MNNNNRLNFPMGQNDPSKLNKGQMQDAVNKIKSKVLEHAAKLFPLIGPGMMVKIKIPLLIKDKSGVVLVGQKQQYGIMYITRPVVDDIVEGKVEG